MPGMTLKIAKNSEQHKKFVQEISSRIKIAETEHGKQHAKWEQAEKTIAAYVPESADDARRRAERDSRGFQTYTTIMIPYSYALLMAAHTYWTSVFFARDPVHQYSGRHGEGEMQVLGLESVISYQTKIGGMLAPYYLWVYDTGKYGIGILGTYWDQEIRTYSVLAEENGEAVYVTNQVRGYTGNKVYNVQPWDFLPDPRVPVNRFQDGEFCAVYRSMSWAELITRASRRYYVNTDEIKKAPTRQNFTSGDAYLERPRPIDIGSDEAKHPAWVGLYEVYIRLIPKEWGLGGMEAPELWVFTVTADLSLIIGAQPLGAIHDRYPFDILDQLL